MTTTATEPALHRTDNLPVVPHWIGGAAVAPTAGRTGDVFDPALGVVTKRVPLADQADADAAVASAKAAYPAWRDLSLARR